MQEATTKDWPVSMNPMPSCSIATFVPHRDGSTPSPIMFTTHPTDNIKWGDLKMFVERLRQYYELLDREIIAVNSYHNSGWDFMSNSQEKPPENGIEIQWKETHNE